MSWLAALGGLRRALDERPAAEIEADVRAEIEHHLECAVRARVEAGTEPEQARAEALVRFGDVSRVERECLWVHTREKIVLQRVHLAVTVLLVVAVLFLVARARQAEGAARQAAAATAEQVEGARLLALEAALRAREAPEPVENVVVEVGDELAIVDEYNAEEIAGTQVVAQDGKVVLPEAGWVRVAGMTREEAEQALTQALTPYFVQTKVRVRVTKAGDTLLRALLEGF